MGLSTDTAGVSSQSVFRIESVYVPGLDESSNAEPVTRSRAMRNEANRLPTEANRLPTAGEGGPPEAPLEKENRAFRLHFP